MANSINQYVHRKKDKIHCNQKYSVFPRYLFSFHNSNGKNYKYLKLCFANRSKPLLNSVLKILRKFYFDAYIHGDQVFVNSILGIKKYFAEIGTHNPKHLDKIIKFLVN